MVCKFHENMDIPIKYIYNKEGYGGLNNIKVYTYAHGDMDDARTSVI